MKAGKTYMLMKTAVIRSCQSQVPVAVMTQTTATDMKMMAKKMGLSIPEPVVVRGKFKRVDRLSYDYLDAGGV